MRTGVWHRVLELQACKFQCQSCGRYLRERYPGMQPCQRSSEAFQRVTSRRHLDRINRSRLGRREGIGAATVERYLQRGLERQFGEWHARRCPQVLGIDEHFFTRRTGYATTLCDLKNHTDSCSFCAPRLSQAKKFDCHGRPASAE